MIFMPFFVVAALLVTIGSCTKNGNSITATYNATIHDSTDVPRIRAFLATKPIVYNSGQGNVQLTGMSRDSMLFFKHVPPDSGKHCPTLDLGNHCPTLDSGVVFNYSLRLLTHDSKRGRDTLSKVIDSVGVPGYTVSPLSETLPAISRGLLHINRGERIILVVPSSLGFRDNPTDVTNNLLSGGQATTTVPANSILVFDITLVRLRRNF